MKKQVFFAGLLLFSLPVLTFAQSNEDKGEELPIIRALNQSSNNQTGGNAITEFDTSDKSVVGHPFFAEPWLVGSVRTISGRKFDNVQLRYSIFDFQLLCKQDNGSVIILDPKQIASFTLPGNNGQNIEFKPVVIKGEPLFAEVIFESNNIQGFMVHRKIFLKGRELNDGYSPNTRSRYETNNETWLVINGVQKQVKRTAASVSGAFDDRKKEIQAYIKKEKLKLTDNRDLAKVLAYAAATQSKPG
jgi:hypothetical protein